VIRLCFGSCVRVFTLRKSAAGKSQKNISSSIALSIAHDYFIGDEDRTTSDWAICKKNLPDDVIAEAKKILENDNGMTFREDFSKSVLPLINENKYSDIVLALKDIIANDTDIQPIAIVDKVSQITKAELAKLNTFDVAGFLAGILLYAVTVVNNTDGKFAINEIDENYMSQFSGRENEVQFVDKIDYSYTRNNDSEITEEAYTYEDNQTENAAEDTSGQTVNNTAFVFQQFGTDNKQIVGNVETLIINNKGE